MLTDREIKALKPTGTRFEVADDFVAGLALCVTPNGIKSWSLRYRVGGRRCRGSHSADIPS